MQINVTSFGYGHAPAPAADLVLDARELFRNPARNADLRHQNGRDQAVQQHVHATPGVRALVLALVQTANALITAATATGRTPAIAIGCAGGRHRSVVLTDALAAALREQQHQVVVVHRDIDREVLEPGAGSSSHGSPVV